MSVRYGDDPPVSYESKPEKKHHKHKSKKHHSSDSSQSDAEEKQKYYQESNGADDDEKGEPYQYDKDFHGAVGDRHCTDCCCLLIFLVFFAGMLAIFFYGLTISNVKYLYIPTDYRSLLCGYDNSKLNVDNASILPDLTDRPYLFWTRPGKKGYVRSYCVKECPDSGMFTDTFQQNIEGYEPGELNSPCNCEDGEECATHRTVPGYEIPYDKEEDEQNKKKYYCAYNTTVLLQRCMPTLNAFVTEEDQASIASLTENMSELLSGNILATAVQDVVNTYPYIAIAAAATLVVAFIWILLMRWTAPCFVWLTVILALAASAALTYLCWGQKENKWNNASTAEAYTFGLYNEDLNHDVFTVLFWICVAWDIILFLLVLGLFHKIRVSVAVIKIVSRAFSEVKTLFIFPIFVYIIMFIWWVYVVAVAIVLFGAGKPSYQDDPEIGPSIKYEYDYVVAGLSIYHFVGFIWVSLFITDLGEMSLAGVFAAWYFQREPRRKNMGRAPVWYSFKRSIRYHTGSIAFGSFIITIIKVIRAVIYYLQQKTKGTENEVVKCLLKCAACCCWCFEKFMKFINRNAYILIAIHGYNFFGACKKAFGLILRNCVQVATVNWVGDFTLFLGRVFVTGIVTGVSCYLFAQMDDVTFYVVPGALVCIISFFASGAFTDLFEMGIDSMFLCYMEDRERNDGSAGHEMYGPPELTGYLDKNDNPEAEI